MLKRALIIALAFCFGLATFPVVNLAATTQESLEQMQRSLEEERIQTDALKGDVSKVKGDLSKLLAMMEAAEKVALGKEVAQASLPKAQETGKKALGALDAIPDGGLGTDSSGQDLKARLVACLAPLKDQTAPIDPSNLKPDLANQVMKTCGKEQITQIKGELEKHRQKLFEDYTSCRQAMLDTNQIWNDGLPDDPSGLSPEQFEKFSKNIEKFNSQVQGTYQLAADCGKRIEQTAKDLKNTDNSAAAAAAMLEMVGVICVASGGTGCAAAFILAALLQGFGSGNGDGDGDGKPGSGADDPTGMSTASGDSSGDGSDGGEVKPSPENLGGTFGTTNVNGVSCTVLSGPKLACKTGSTTTTIDPALAVDDGKQSKQTFVDLLNRNDGANVGVCTTAAPSVTLLALVIFQPSGWIHMPLKPNIVAGGSPIGRFVKNDNYGGDLAQTTDLKSRLAIICKIRI